MKKYLLSAAMVLSFLGVPFAYADIAPEPDALPVQIQEGVNVFSDVIPGSTYYDALLYLKNLGVIDGYSDGSFKPDTAINRAEFTKIVMKASRLVPYTSLTSCRNPQTGLSFNFFTDIYEGGGTEEVAWYVSYICSAKQAGLINGYPDGSFKPEQNINFVEAAKILDHAFNITPENSPVPGAPAPAWYVDYVTVLADHKAIPVTITRFDQMITRGEMAEMAFRLKSANKNLPSKTFNDLQ